MIDDTTSNKHSWIDNIKKNPNEALRSIYKEERSYCIGWLQKNSSLDKEACIDIFQHSVVILYDNIISSKLTEATSKRSTYLISICRNKSLEYYRKQKRTGSEEEMPILIDYIKEEEGYEEKQVRLISAVKDILIDMGNPCHKLLILYYYDKMSMSEIAEEMDYSNPDTAKNQKYKCIKRLRKRSASITV